MADNGFSMMKREAKLGRSLFSQPTRVGKRIDFVDEARSCTYREVHLRDRSTLIPLLTDSHYCRIDNMLLNCNNKRAARAEIRFSAAEN